MKVKTTTDRKKPATSPAAPTISAPERKPEAGLRPIDRLRAALGLTAAVPAAAVLDEAADRLTSVAKPMVAPAASPPGVVKKVNRVAKVHGPQKPRTILRPIDQMRAALILTAAVSEDVVLNQAAERLKKR